MSEALFSLTTKEGERQLFEIQKRLDGESEAVLLPHEDVKKSVIQILRKTQELSDIMQESVRSIVAILGIPLRAICNELIGIDDAEADDQDEYMDDEEDPYRDEGQGMPSILVDGPMLPPAPSEGDSQFTYSFGIPSFLYDHPRVKVLREILSEIGIVEKDCIRIEIKEKPAAPKKTKGKKERSHKNMYEVISIPELQKIVFVSDKGGNATYIIRAETHDAEKFLHLHKYQLRSQLNVEFLPWKHIAEWKVELKNILIARSPRAYFREENAERIRRELMAFAEKVGGGIDVKKLPEWSFPGTKIVDQDGNIITGYDYVEQAALEMGITRHGGARIPRNITLTKILELVGIQ